MIYRLPLKAYNTDNMINLVIDRLFICFTLCCGGIDYKSRLTECYIYQILHTYSEPHITFLMLSKLLDLMIKVP